MRFAAAATKYFGHRSPRTIFKRSAEGQLNELGTHLSDVANSHSPAIDSTQNPVNTHRGAFHFLRKSQPPPALWTPAVSGQFAPPNQPFSKIVMYA